LGSVGCSAGGGVTSSTVTSIARSCISSGCAGIDHNSASAASAWIRPELAAAGSDM
jgi:hypothetical protein